MHENRIYYNVPEANSQIPRLEILFGELARIQMQVNALASRAAEMGIELDLDEMSEEEETTHSVKCELSMRTIALTEQYNELLDEITGMGLVIDDLDLGIVNFYSWMEGKEVFLSWQYGEPEVGHWHAVTENSIARRSLKNLMRCNPLQASLH